MMEVDELALALNWAGVFQGQDCPVVHFNLNQIGMIQGLRSNNQTLYLNYPEYERALISFLVTDGAETHQYWVMGDRLHRANGPAKIYYNHDTRQSTASWYQNGMLHNVDGPAVIEISKLNFTQTHPLTGEVLGDDWMVETWESLTGYWRHYGEEARYPDPHSMLCENGFRIFNTTANPVVISDYKNSPGFFAERVFGNWDREGLANQNDTFRLRWMVMEGYERSYVSGDPRGHKCNSILEMNWIMNGELIASTPESRLRIQRDLFPVFNIWEGPLFPNVQEAMFAFSEVARG